MNFNKVVEMAMAFAPNLAWNERMHMSFMFHGKHIVSFGHNSPKTHTEAFLRGYPYPYIHSELSCFLNRPKNIVLEDCILVNIRLSRLSLKYKKPILRMSKPCIHCHRWVYPMFKECWYSDDFGFNKL